MAKLKTDCEKVGTLAVTSRYDYFKISSANRGIDRRKVEKLKLSIEQEDQGVFFPIVVNCANEILDGQHRYIARQELDLPLFFIKIDEPQKADPDISISNSHVYKWTPLNIVTFLANKGSETHARFLADYHESGLGWSAFCGLALRSWPDVEELKYGFIYDEKQSASFKERLRDFSIFNNYPFHREARFVRAFSLLTAAKGYKHKVMAQKVAKYPSLLQKQVSGEKYTEALKAQYNYFTPKGERI